MKIKLIVTFLIVHILSCNNSKDQLKEQILDYVKTKVRNPNTVKIHDYQVFDRNEKDNFSNPKSKTNTINDKSEFINFIFSANNSDGNEIFREAAVYLDRKNKNFIRSFPENIDIENGYLSGSCKYIIGNPITNWGIQDYCNNAKVTIMNVDSLGGKKVYFTQVKDGTYEINKIIPGNYFIKIIHYGINLELIYGRYGEQKNNCLLREIEKIMSFYDIYSNYLNYGFENKNLFKETYSKLQSDLSNLESQQFTDYDVDNIWKKFKNSVNRQFLIDFDINDDFRYLNKFEKLSIESSIQTKHDLKIDEYFF